MFIRSPSPTPTQTSGTFRFATSSPVSRRSICSSEGTTETMPIRCALAWPHRQAAKAAGAPDA